MNGLYLVLEAGWVGSCLFVFDDALSVALVM